MNFEYRLSRGSNKVGEPAPDRSCQCTQKVVGKSGQVVQRVALWTRRQAGSLSYIAPWRVGVGTRDTLA